MLVPLPCPIPNQCRGTGLQQMGQFKALSPGIFTLFVINIISIYWSVLMTPEQKIKAAKQRIKELEILIKSWTDKKVNTIRL